MRLANRKIAQHYAGDDPTVFPALYRYGHRREVLVFAVVAEIDMIHARSARELRDLWSLRDCIVTESIS